MRVTTRRMALLLAPLLSTANVAPQSAPELRLTPAEVEALPAHDSGPGTSGVAGIRTTVVGEIRRSRGPIRYG